VADAGRRAVDSRVFRDVLLKSLYKKAEGPAHT